MLASTKPETTSRTAAITGACRGVCTMISATAPIQVMGAFTMIRIMPLINSCTCATSLVIRVIMDAGRRRSIFSMESSETLWYISLRSSFPMV